MNRVALVVAVLSHKLRAGPPMPLIAMTTGYSGSVEKTRSMASLVYLQGLFKPEPDHWPDGVLIVVAYTGARIKDITIVQDHRHGILRIPGRS